jgi:hypothetical protein
MNAKLTLNLNKDVIGKAKNYARARNQSLSGMVQNYFVFLAENEELEDSPIADEIKEISGIIELDDAFDVKEEYGKYLTEKYK